MKTLTLLILIAGISGVFLKQLNFRKWDEFKNRFNKKIQVTAELKRMQKFFDNLDKIIAHNKEYLRGKTKYLSDINKLADLVK